MRPTLLAQYEKLKTASDAVKWRAVSQFNRLAAKSRGTGHILSVWPAGFATEAARIAIYMHFDRFGKVSAPVLHTLQELAASGYCVIFVTNSGKLTPQSETALRNICSAIFVRRNIGYDFGAWRDVIETLHLPAADTEELIILNDSMYGPIRPLGPMLARLNYAEADIWGLTDSWQHRYHLQSFFLAFGGKALHSAAFAKFWREILSAPFKSFIIREYEIGLTQQMLKAGLRCKALWGYDELLNEVTNQHILDNMARAERSRSGRADPILKARKLQIDRIRGASVKHVAMNPTADLWRQLLLGGFPFIKRELLRTNPSQVEDVGEWVTVVRGELGLDPEPIIGELRGALKNRAP